MSGSFGVPPAHSRTDWPEVQQMMQVFLRFITGCVALLVMIAGLSFAFTAFNLVRGTIEDPEKAIAYLNKWADSLKNQETQSESPLEVPDAAQQVPEKAPDKPAKTTAPSHKLKQTQPPKQDWEDVWRFLASVSSSDSARPVAALFLIVLILILVRIPIVLIQVGGRLALAVVKAKGE